MRVNRIAIFCVVIFIFTAANAVAVSYTDADADGICEPDEVITFYGDPGYDYYDWDFNADGLPEDNGEIVTYIFEEEGEYVVTVIQSDGHTIQITIIVVVETDDEQDTHNQNKDKCKGFAKMIRIVNRNLPEQVRNEIIIKLIGKEYKKMLGYEPTESEMDDLMLRLGQYLS